MTRGYIDEPADLGRIVLATRLGHKLSQDALSAQLGISQRYLSELERGRTKLFDDKFIGVLNQLGIRLTVEVDE